MNTYETMNLILLIAQIIVMLLSSGVRRSQKTQR